jgi:pimeloyl-ACP methyl ester carboxylesterase
VTRPLELLRLEGEPEKPPVLFLHGAWLSAWCWRHWMAFFHARGHTVLAPSYRAHGASPGGERLRWTPLSAYLEDALWAFDQLPQPPLVVAHSMGGAVAQHLLMRRTARAAVLVASVPPNGVIGSTLRLAAHHPLEFLKINLTLSLYPAVSSPALVREMFYSPTTPESIVLEGFQNVQDESFTAFLGMIAFRSKLEAGRVPMLVLGGESDGIFTPSEVRATAERYAAALKLYPDTGHNLMLEPNHDAVATDVHEWFRALP